MPFYLAKERSLGIPTMAVYLSWWMFVAIFAYWICGWLCDQFGRRYVIPAFAVPARNCCWWPTCPPTSPRRRS